MAHFGPAANSRRFYDEGNKSTAQAAWWLAQMGLTAFEYSFGRGVNLKISAAEEIGQHMKAHGIAVSGHAPYFINLVATDDDKRAGNLRYALESATALDAMGGQRLVVHPGYCKGIEREVAFERAASQLAEIRSALDSEGFSHITLCPETMGQLNQFGHLDEVLRLCQTDERHVPCLDFAHIHALHQGCLNTSDDFAAVLDRCAAVLGDSRMKHTHVHFSHIVFSKAGERRHMRFADTDYGPNFALLAPLMRSWGWEPVFICESAGTQADDAAEMLRIWEGAEGEINLM